MNSKFSIWIFYFVCLAVVGTTLGFWRNSSDVFDLTKATILWLCSLFVLVPLVAHVLRLERNQLRSEIRAFGSVGIFLLVAWSTSLAVSDFRGLSVFGDAGRYTSLLTLTSGGILFLAVRQLSIVQVRRVMLAIIIGHVVSANYGLVQEMGSDPFLWQSGSFGRFVFGTMGNPNFAATLAVVGCALSGFFLVDLRSSRVIRILAGYSLALGVGMLGLFDSFQGNVALISLTFVVGYVWSASGLSQWWTICGTLGSLFLVGLSLWIDSAGAALSLALLGLVGGYVLDRSLGRVSASKARPRWSRRNLVLVATGAVCVIAVGAVALRSTISSGLAQGFVERGDFYRAAWKGIQDKPLFGFGLDTFGRYYTNYRPIGHALRWENNRTSSVHSVYLGFLFSGGIVLLVSFLAMVLHPVIKAISVLKKRRPEDGHLLVGLLGALSSLLIVFIVSTEHVTVHALFFVVLGSVSRLAFPPEPSTADVPKRERTRRRKSLQKRASIGMASALVFSLVMLPFVTKPFRAARSDYLGQVAFSTGNSVGALEEFQRASATAPWVSAYHLRTAEMAVSLELPELARSEAYQAAIRGNFISSEAVKAARILGLTRDLENAMFVLERAFLNDPYALGLGSLIEELANTVSDVAEREGDPELVMRARSLVDRIVETRKELES